MDLPPTSTSDVLRHFAIFGRLVRCLSADVLLPATAEAGVLLLLHIPGRKDYRQLSLDRVGCRAGVGDIVRRHMLVGLR